MSARKRSGDMGAGLYGRGGGLHAMLAGVPDSLPWAKRVAQLRFGARATRGRGYQQRLGDFARRQLLARLPFDELMAMSRVSCEWRATVAGDATLWRALFEREFVAPYAHVRSLDDYTSVELAPALRYVCGGDDDARAESLGLCFVQRIQTGVRAEYNCYEGCAACWRTGYTAAENEDTPSDDGGEEEAAVCHPADAHTHMHRLRFDGAHLDALLARGHGTFSVLAWRSALHAAYAEVAETWKRQHARLFDRGAVLAAMARAATYGGANVGAFQPHPFDGARIRGDFSELYGSQAPNALPKVTVFRMSLLADVLRSNSVGTVFWQCAEFTTGRTVYWHNDVAGDDAGTEAWLAAALAAGGHAHQYMATVITTYSVRTDTQPLPAGAAAAVAAAAAARGMWSHARMLRALVAARGIYEVEAHYSQRVARTCCAETVRGLAGAHVDRVTVTGLRWRQTAAPAVPHGQPPPAVADEPAMAEFIGDVHSARLLTIDMGTPTGSAPSRRSSVRAMALVVRLYARAEAVAKAAGRATSPFARIEIAVETPADVVRALGALATLRRTPSVALPVGARMPDTLAYAMRALAASHVNDTVLALMRATSPLNAAAPLNDDGVGMLRLCYGARQRRNFVWGSRAPTAHRVLRWLTDAWYAWHARTTRAPQRWMCVTSTAVVARAPITGASGRVHAHAECTLRFERATPHALAVRQRALGDAGDDVLVLVLDRTTTLCVSPGRLDVTMTPDAFIYVADGGNGARRIVGGGATARAASTAATTLCVMQLAPAVYADGTTEAVALDALGRASMLAETHPDVCLRTLFGAGACVTYATEVRFAAPSPHTMLLRPLMLWFSAYRCRHRQTSPYTLRVRETCDVELHANPATVPGTGHAAVRDMARLAIDDDDDGDKAYDSDGDCVSGPSRADMAAPAVDCGANADFDCVLVLERVVIPDNAAAASLVRKYARGATGDPAHPTPGELAAALHHNVCMLLLELCAWFGVGDTVRVDADAMRRWRIDVSEPRAVMADIDTTCERRVATVTCTWSSRAAPRPMRALYTRPDAAAPPPPPTTLHDHWRPDH
jgi:hypothetical protein